MKQYRMCLKGVGEVTAAKTGCLSMKELTGMVKAMQEKEKAQEKLIYYLQQLIQQEGLSVLDDFPYPAVAYQEDGTLTYGNRAFSLETGVLPADLLSGRQSVPRHGDIYEISEM